jgi:hypothetical protein
MNRLEYERRLDDERLEELHAILTKHRMKRKRTADDYQFETDLVDSIYGLMAKSEARTKSQPATTRTRSDARVCIGDRSDGSERTGAPLVCGCSQMTRARTSTFGRATCPWDNKECPYYYEHEAGEEVPDLWDGAAIKSLGEPTYDNWAALVGKMRRLKKDPFDLRTGVEVYRDNSSVARLM